MKLSVLFLFLSLFLFCLEFLHYLQLFTMNVVNTGPFWHLLLCFFFIETEMITIHVKPLSVTNHVRAGNMNLHIHSSSLTPPFYSLTNSYFLIKLCTFLFFFGLLYRRHQHYVSGGGINNIVIISFL